MTHIFHTVHKFGHLSLFLGTLKVIQVFSRRMLKAFYFCCVQAFYREKKKCDKMLGFSIVLLVAAQQIISQQSNPVQPYAQGLGQPLQLSSTPLQPS